MIRVFKMFKSVSAMMVALAFVLSVSLSSCGGSSTDADDAEDVMEEVEEGAEEVMDEVEEAADEIKEEATEEHPEGEEHPTDTTATEN